MLPHRLISSVGHECGVFEARGVVHFLPDSRSRVYFSVDNFALFRFFIKLKRGGGGTGDSLYVVLYLFLKIVRQHRVCTLSALRWRRQSSLSRLCRPEPGPNRRILLKHSSRVWCLCSLAMRTRKAELKRWKNKYLSVVFVFLASNCSLPLS